MPKKLHVVALPEYSEFLFFCMATAPAEVLKDLTPQELKYFKTKASMRRFAFKESLDKRISLMARLGINFFIIAAPRAPQTNAIMTELRDQYVVVDKRKAITEAMAANKIFVISAADALISAHMGNQNCLSQIYQLNPEYIGLSAELRKLKVDINEKDFKDARQAFDTVSKLVLNAASMLDKTDALLSLTQLETLILLSILPYRNSFTSVDRLTELLGGSLRSKGIAKTATGLETKGYLVRMPGHDETGKKKKQSFTLSNTGLNAAYQCLRFIVDRSLV